ncbi:hypothetical protein FPSE_01937 [Fusarium pseudograminearum CS3096]|uniref:Uncharacterized protein n=1 Tax=Fusarium pseudograminearum (strain CS3096) TaxID=1028729 RepID=K3VRP0_FUSPC|nr:hypothetical protein FPSE_01937 [Fusarium pseudograminearum CS3096]EKJ77844.1 hypothetical protein FPSE_01937 [Fusarium pseudograminearum CS3096]KAF0638354.1 hypothetical protein FPSE5266_01937 [Fusarium pseudograminearum]
MGNTPASPSTSDSTEKKSLYRRYKDSKAPVPLSDEDIKKYTGKTREELGTWADSTPGVGKNQLAGRAMIGEASGLAGVAMADGYGGWGPSAEPNDVNRGMKFPPKPAEAPPNEVIEVEAKEKK